LRAYKRKQIDWVEYERRFKDLIATRHVEEQLARDRFDGACLLCSEDNPHHCHRRLVAEYLQDRWDDIEIVHL
jgi:uncharacterized protein (DUF488 family)